MKHLKKEKLSPGELYRMKLFKHILTELKKRNISVEIVDEN